MGRVRLGLFAWGGAVSRLPAPMKRALRLVTPGRFRRWRFARGRNDPSGLLQRHRHWRPRVGIVHVGAHLCEERDFYRSLGIPDERVLWVEAQPEVAARAGAVQAVVSDVDGEEVEFTVTSNSQSSTMLRLKEHSEVYPNIVATGTLRLQTTTLDSLYLRLGLPFDFADLLILDIQGAELRGLGGARRVLEHMRTVITEVSERELFEGSALYPEVRHYLEELGFREIEVRMHPVGWGNALFGRIG